MFHKWSQGEKTYLKARRSWQEQVREVHFYLAALVKGLLCHRSHCSRSPWPTENIVKKRNKFQEHLSKQFGQTYIQDAKEKLMTASWETKTRQGFDLEARLWERKYRHKKGQGSSGQRMYVGKGVDL